MADDYPMLFPDSAPFGLNIHNPQKPVKDLGLSWVRYDVWWQEITKEHPAFDFEKAKSDIKFYRDQNINVLAVLHLGPLTDYKKGDSADKQIEEAEKYAKAAVLALKDNHILWEVGNEPEGNPLYSDPKVYTKIAKAYAKIIKAEDETGKVCVGSMAWVDRPFLTTCLEEGILDDGLVDVVSYHGYHRKDYEPETGLEEDIAWMRDMIKKYAPVGKYVSLIDSERGFGIFENPYEPRHWAVWRNFVTCETAQAYWLARHYIETIYNQIEIGIWYKDYNGETSYSLYSGDEGSALRPMGVVFKNMAHHFKENSVKLKNDKYKYIITGPNSDKLFHRSLLSKKENNHSCDRLYIAYWNPVEAFDGKILEKRERIGENFVDTWRDIKESDLVEITPTVKVKNVKEVAAVYSYDLLSEDFEAGFKPCKFKVDGGTLVIKGVTCSAAPALVIVDFR